MYLWFTSKTRLRVVRLVPPDLPQISFETWEWSEEPRGPTEDEGSPLPLMAGGETLKILQHQGPECKT